MLLGHPHDGVLAIRDVTRALRIEVLADHEEVKKAVGELLKSKAARKAAASAPVVPKQGEEAKS